MRTIEPTWEAPHMNSTGDAAAFMILNVHTRSRISPSNSNIASRNACPLSAGLYKFRIVNSGPSPNPSTDRSACVRSIIS